MSGPGIAQIGLFLGVLLALALPLGSFMARVFDGRRTFLHPVVGPVERAVYRLIGVDPEAEMSWTTYAGSMLAFSLTGWLLAYLIQRLQGLLPVNPDRMPAVDPCVAFNTAVSFVTNTNWQAYGGEATMSYLTQMAALTVQNFVSAASGIAVLIALIRGLTRRSASSIGNYWADLVRATAYVLLPLSLVLALVLVSQGVVQTLSLHRQVALLEPVSYEREITDAAGTVVSETVTLDEQRLAVGPVASQVAIKQLGTNGGGFFNVNSAHPFENPTPLSNFLETLAILLIPAALCFTFGAMVKDRRQGRALLAAMFVIFLPLLVLAVQQEQRGNRLLTPLGVDQKVSATQAGGNMEGKEARFGISASALWASATTAASNGSVNSMHDSYTPLGGLVPMFLIQLGEVAFGGVGSGLYGMLVFVIVAVFAAGLMVGRTPEYLGKKIEPFEMKMAAIAILVMPIVVLTATAVAVVTRAGTASIANPGPHGFSEVLYAFSSAGNNNGSAFAGLNANTAFYTLATGLAMLVGRFLIMVPVLALAGSLAAKKTVPPGSGTLPTHGPVFVGWLVAVVVIVGGLTFFPALALGPIVEHLMLP
jgi:K+-transporting ATPase ATPase A chain